jgi:hypothetical protein
VDAVKNLNEFLAGRIGKWRRRINRNIDKNSFCRNRGGSYSGHAERGTGRNVYKYDGLYKKPNKFGILKVLRSNKGNALISFLISFTVLAFLLIQPLDNFVIQGKHQMAEKIVNKYLTRMRLEGRLSTEDKAAMVSEFHSIKCIIQNPDTDITAKAIEPQDRVLRSSDPEQSELELKVVCEPSPQPFGAFALLGSNSESVTITVGGKDISERVNP